MTKIVFLGTPLYVMPVLNLLHKTFKSGSGESPIVAVVTQPPKPTGRKQKLSYSPVDTWAHKKKLPIFFDAGKLLKEGVKADIGILASYGAIIPKEVISHFPHGILNIHPSLLPKWRGASPVQATLVAGEGQAGATIIKIDELMDHGPIISQFSEEILPSDTTETLREKLFARSAEVLTALIEPYLMGKINLRKQNHTDATYTKLIKREHGFIPPEYINAALQGKALKVKWETGFLKDFSVKPTPQSLERFIRAMQPWPVSWTYVQLSKRQEVKGKRLKILKAHLKPLNINHQSLVIDEVQLEGKNPVSWKQFKDGYTTATFL